MLKLYCPQYSLPLLLPHDPATKVDRYTMRTSTLADVTFRCRARQQRRSGPCWGGGGGTGGYAQPASPTSQPNQPANQPTSQPANQPASQPASQPANQPASQPAKQPAKQPASQPGPALLYPILIERGPAAGGEALTDKSAPRCTLAAPTSSSESGRDNQQKAS